MTPKFEGPFQWGKIRDQLLSLRDDTLTGQKLAGKNISRSVYPGKGTVINANRKRGGAGTGACCIGTDCSISTEADCITAGGTYQGDDTTCDPNPCGGGGDTGACCYTNGACDDGLTSEECSEGGGSYQGDGSTCAESECINCTGGTLNVDFSFTATCNQMDDACLCKWSGMSIEGSCSFSNPPDSSCNDDIFTCCEGVGACSCTDPIVVGGTTYFSTETKGWKFEASLNCAEAPGRISAFLTLNPGCQECIENCADCDEDCGPGGCRGVCVTDEISIPLDGVSGSTPISGTINCSVITDEGTCDYEGTINWSISSPP